MGNSTEDRNAISSEAFYLATVTITLNILLSITASLGNTLILIVLRKVTSLHSPTKLLFQCLTINDFAVGLISQPLYVIYLFLINYNLKLWNIISILHDITWALSMCLSGVSVLTTTALSVDRLLALLLKLRYRHVVTVKRARAVVFCFRLIPVLGIFEFLFWDTNIAVATLSVSAMLCIVISLLSYTIIFIKLRLHQATVHPTVQCNVHHGQPVGGGFPALNIAQFQKTVTSIALVQWALVICYIPFVILNAILLLNSVLANSEVFGLASNLVFSTLIFLNSSLNPFLYCWRIKEVRQAVKATIKQLYCNCLR